MEMFLISPNTEFQHLLQTQNLKMTLIHSLAPFRYDSRGPGKLIFKDTPIFSELGQVRSAEFLVKVSLFVGKLGLCFASLGVSLCGFGSVGVGVVTCVCREQADTEPPAFSLSKFLRTCVPVRDSHSLAELSGFEAMAISLAAAGTKSALLTCSVPSPCLVRVACHKYLTTG